MVRALSREDLERRSANVEDKLWTLPLFRQARRIMGFYPLAGEPDLRRLMKRLLRERELFLPVIDKQNSMLFPYPVTDLESLTEGPYGTRQPKVHGTHIPHEVDCVLVPGVAFNPSGDRLGRGKGYYDRFLATLPQSVVTIGVCFSCQLVDNLPTHSSLDQKVSLVITD